MKPMQPLQIDQNTDINYLVPLSACDGTLIGANVATGMANLIFYQTRKLNGSHIDKVDVIGAVGMSIKDLEQFRDAITENLDSLKNREK